MMVLLPAPDGPTRAKVCPGGTTKETFFRIGFLKEKTSMNNRQQQNICGGDSFGGYRAWVGGRALEHTFVSLGTGQRYEKS